MRNACEYGKPSVRQPGARSWPNDSPGHGHVTFLKYPDSERGRRLIERMKAVSESEPIGVAIVTVEERMRGWLAVIAKEKSALRQVLGYRELALLFEFYQEF